MRKIGCFLLAFLLAVGGVVSALADEEERVLRVWNCFADARFYQAVQQTQAQYPGLVVEECYEDQNRTLLSRLFTQDPDIDIICFQDWNDGISGRYLLQSGLLEDLGQYDVLTSLRSDLLDVIHIYEQDEKWFGIPNNMTASLWYGNIALFEELGLSFPADHWTWEDVYALGEQLHCINEEQGASYKLIYEANVSPYVLKQFVYNTTDYVNGTHQLDSEAFRQLVEMWMQLRAWGLCGEIADRGAEVGERKVISDTLICIAEKPFGKSGLAIVDPGIKVGEEKESFRMVMPPASEGFHKGLVRGYGLGITSFSQMKDEAAYFLSCYFALMQQDTLAPGSMYTDGMGNFGPINGNRVDWGEDGFAEGTWARANVEYWLAYVDDCQGEYFDEHMARTVVNTAYWELRDGEISIDEYISRCINIADRYLGE